MFSGERLTKKRCVCSAHWNLNASAICKMHQDMNILFVMNDTNKDSNDMIIHILLDLKNTECEKYHTLVM